MIVKVRLKLDWETQRLIFKIKMPGDWFYDRYIPRIKTDNDDYWDWRYMSKKEELEAISNIESIKNIVTDYCKIIISKRQKHNKEYSEILELDSKIKSFNKNKYEFDINLEQ
jgi:hypothetical protein